MLIPRMLSCTHEKTMSDLWKMEKHCSNLIYYEKTLLDSWKGILIINFLLKISRKTKTTLIRITMIVDYGNMYIIKFLIKKRVHIIRPDCRDHVDLSMIRFKIIFITKNTIRIMLMILIMRVFVTHSDECKTVHIACHI